MKIKPITYNGSRYYYHSSGYYYGSCKSNRRGTLHKHIYEDTYGPIPDGYVVHHIDFCTTNNDISNLVLMTRHEHSIFHNKGRIVSDETRKKISLGNKGKEPWNKGKKMTDEYKQKYCGPKSGMYGKKSTRRKLTDLDLKFIRFWLECGFSLIAIANVFNVSKSTIHHIKLGQIYKK